MEVPAVAAKSRSVPLADDDGLVAAELVSHDHGGPTRSLARTLLQQMMRRLLVVDDYERHAKDGHGADAAVEIFVLQPMLVFEHAIGGEVSDVPQDRKRSGTWGQSAVAPSARLSEYDAAGQSNDAP